MPVINGIHAFSYGTLDILSEYSIFSLLSNMTSKIIHFTCHIHSVGSKSSFSVLNTVGILLEILSLRFPGLSFYFFYYIFFLHFTILIPSLLIPIA